MSKSIIEIFGGCLEKRRNQLSECLKLLKGTQYEKVSSWTDAKKLELNEYQYRLYLSRYEATTLEKYRHKIATQLSSRLKQVDHMYDKLKSGQFQNIQSDEFARQVMIYKQQQAYLNNLLKTLRSIPKELDELKKTVETERAEIKNSRQISMEQIKGQFDKMKRELEMREVGKNTWNPQNQTRIQALHKQYNRK